MLSLLAAALLTQCATGITDNAQTLCGIKTFPNGLVVGSGGAIILAGGSYIHSENAIYISDGVPAESSSPSFYLQSFNARTGGPLIRVDNSTIPVMVLSPNGALRLYGDEPIRIVGHSGHASLAAEENGYLYVVGSLPPNYWGHHGALTIGNENKQIAGYTLQLTNGRTVGGGATDYIAQWNYLGGWETQANLRSYEMPICDGTDVNPDPTQPSNRYGPGDPLYCGPNADGGPIGYDGGVCHNWYIATDAGHAMDGCILPWIVDVRAPCQCDSTLYDGGLTSSWRKLQNRAECRP